MACVPTGTVPEQLQDAKVAFVGTVTATEDADTTATVAVESVWLGPGLPHTVRVLSSGAPERRNFIEGRRYLFVPRDAGPPFVDDACTATQIYTPALAKLAPEGAIGPQSGGPSAWVFVLVVLLAVGFWQARRARQRAAELDL